MSSPASPATAIVPFEKKAEPQPAAIDERPDTSTSEEPTDNPPEEKKAEAKRGPAGKVALVLLLIFAAIMAFHVFTDRLAPTSSTGFVAAPTAILATRVSGQVEEIFIADNQAVRKGDRLFAIDPRAFDLAVRQADANLASALQAFDASYAALDALRAKVTQAEANLQSAESAYQRSQELFDKGLSPKSAHDAAVTQLASAQSTLEAVRADLRSNEV